MCWVSKHWHTEVQEVGQAEWDLNNQQSTVKNSNICWVRSVKVMETRSNRHSCKVTVVVSPGNMKRDNLLKTHFNAFLFVIITDYNKRFDHVIWSKWISPVGSVFIQSKSWVVSKTFTDLMISDLTERWSVIWQTACLFWTMTSQPLISFCILLSGY